MLPFAIAENVDPQMPPERFLCQVARELDEKSSLLLQMESEGPKPGENPRGIRATSWIRKIFCMSDLKWLGR